MFFCKDKSFIINDWPVYSPSGKAKNNKVSEFITPTDDMFPDYQSVCLSGVEEMLAKNGNMFKTEKTQEGTIKVYLSDGRFAGVFAYDSVAECYRPEKMFLSEN